MIEPAPGVGGSAHHVAQLLSWAMWHRSNAGSGREFNRFTGWASSLGNPMDWVARLQPLNGIGLLGLTLGLCTSTSGRGGMAIRLGCGYIPK